MDYTNILIVFAIVLASLTVHEAAHAWTADRLGDPTARMLGRVSFNPIVHIDLFGTIILPLIAMFSNLPILGWAKPVPVNTSRLRQPRRDFILVAAAGPASNIVMAVAAAIVYRVLAVSASSDASVEGMGVLFRVVSINVLLAVFNMVPVPPLDGGNVLAGLLPPRAAYEFTRLAPYGFLVLYALIFTGILTAIIMPPYELLVRLLLL